MPESPVPDMVPEILEIDNHLLAVNKPSGTPSQPDASGDDALDDIVRAWLKREFNKPGNVYLALLHRLDRPTSGVVLFARTDKAAGRMADLFRKRAVRKDYLALVDCRRTLPADSGILTNHLAQGGKNGMRVVPAGTREAREARLEYSVLARTGDNRRALLRINLLTGVKHQIRAQLAHIGLPVIGDFRYGPNGKPARPEPIMDGRAVLLHARQVEFSHPVRKEPVSVTAPLPGYWRQYINEMDSVQWETLA